jgi:hypothetical protein
MYPGTSGKAQGEKKEKTPIRKGKLKPMKSTLDPLKNTQLRE